MLNIIKIGRTESARLNAVIDASKSCEDRLIEDPSEAGELLSGVGTGDGFLFAIHIPESGYDGNWMELMGNMAEGRYNLEGSVGGIIVDGEGELFTKDMARKLAFSANGAGMEFPGKPLVEATGSLYNFNTAAAIKSVDNLTAYKEAVMELADRLRTKAAERSNKSGGEFLTGARKKRILALHASNRETSNSLTLWAMVRENLGEEVHIEEISVRNGEVVDCRGCSFETCRHFGEKGDCFYGGLIVEQVYPAILECDALVLVCPNYNDAVSANMMALFNRLTALFYNNDFSSKEVYAIIVSGYSGSDILAQQIIGTLNLNKGFTLPPKFALMATANAPGSILEIPKIEERAAEFAERIIT